MKMTSKEFKESLKPNVLLQPEGYYWVWNKDYNEYHLVYVYEGVTLYGNFNLKDFQPLEMPKRKLEYGFYKVAYQNSRINYIAQFEPEGWMLPGVDDYFEESEFQKIGEKIKL